MKIKKTAEVYRSGLMVQYTMVFGEMEWQMVMEDWCMQKVTCTRVFGPRIKRMVLVFIHISMEADMKANGTKINNTDTELNNGQMELNLRVNTNKA